MKNKIPDIPDEEVVIMISTCQKCSGGVRFCVKHLMNENMVKEFDTEVIKHNLSVKSIPLLEYRTSDVKWCMCSKQKGSDELNKEVEPSNYSSLFLQVIDKLPHSKTRVPYTYHHDYLRQHSKFHSQMSRSQVACNDETDDELYAVALVSILDVLGSKAINHITSSDIFICKKAIQITEGVIRKYNG